MARLNVRGHLRGVGAEVGPWWNSDNGRFILAGMIIHCYENRRESKGGMGGNSILILVGVPLSHTRCLKL